MLRLRPVCSAKQQSLLLQLASGIIRRQDPLGAELVRCERHPGELGHLKPELALE
jgi:hypothetical protein